MGAFGAFIGRLLIAALFLLSGSMKLQSAGMEGGSPVVKFMAPRLDSAVAALHKHTGFTLVEPVRALRSLSLSLCDVCCCVVCARRVHFKAVGSAQLAIARSNRHHHHQSAARHHQRAQGMYEHVCVLAGALELLGGVLFVLNVRLGAVLLVRREAKRGAARRKHCCGTGRTRDKNKKTKKLVFLAPTTAIMHDFWNLPGERQRRWRDRERRERVVLCGVDVPPVGGETPNFWRVPLTQPTPLPNTHMTPQTGRRTRSSLCRS